MDAALFHFINSTLANSAFDFFFPWFTNIQRTATFHFFLLPVILIATFYSFRLRGLAVLAVGAILTWSVDVLCSIAIKPLVNRPRPFEVLPDAIVRVAPPGGSSFPSGHAVDAFFLAVFLTFIYPRLSWLYFAIAFLIAVSRVYIGVHYPGDVFGGAVIGSALAISVMAFYRRLDSRRKGTV